jgi:hypothetical protein
MRFVTASLLILCYLALGSGAMERLHNAQHAAEDAAQLSLASLPGAPVAPISDHNDSNCAIHAQLHFSTSIVAWVPLLICIGLFVAFLTMLPRPIPVAHYFHFVSCRGPPVG